MSGVETQQDLLARRVAEVKLVRADDVAFGADAEEFAFDGVEVDFRVELFGEHGVEAFGEIEDIAAATAFLLSNDAKYITGHTLEVNGGWTAYGFI